MRKITMLAAMLAMVLVAAAPALAQATAVGGDVQIQNQYCPQVIDQYASADQDNSGGGVGAGIAQDLGISQNAVNACLQAGDDINLADDDDETVTVVEEEVVPVVEEVVPVVEEEVVEEEVVHETVVEEAVVHEAPAAAASSSAPSESAPPASTTLTVLPDTGGVSLLALGGGVLLLGGGLVARRMFR